VFDVVQIEQLTEYSVLRGTTSPPLTAQHGTLGKLSVVVSLVRERNRSSFVIRPPPSSVPSSLSLSLQQMCITLSKKTTAFVPGIYQSRICYGSLDGFVPQRAIEMALQSPTDVANF